jgi:hypothetical protein
MGKGKTLFLLSLYFLILQIYADGVFDMVESVPLEKRDEFILKRLYQSRSVVDKR